MHEILERDQGVNNVVRARKALDIQEIVDIGIAPREGYEMLGSVRDLFTIVSAWVNRLARTSRPPVSRGGGIRSGSYQLGGIASGRQESLKLRDAAGDSRFHRAQGNV
jgi:hypothetical protein